LDHIINEDEDDETLPDHRAPCGGRFCSGNDNDNDDSEGDDETQGGQKLTRTGNRTNDVQGKGKGKSKGKGKATEEGMGKGKGNSKGTGIVKQTPGGDDISCAASLQLQKQIYEEESDTEG
jgi:hypothetical protein